MYKINLLENYSSSQKVKKSILKKLSFISGLLLVLQLSFLNLMPVNIKAVPAEATGGSCHLTISKSVDKTSALPGDILTYTINYANTGTAVCTGGGVQVFDSLNSHLTYVANSKTIVISNDSEGDDYDPSQGNDYNGHGNDLLYNVRRVSPGESGVITLEATVSELECGNYEIPNKGKIWSDQTSYILSNQVTTNINIPCALVQVPVKTCTGSGELYLFQNNQFQTINATFTVQRDRLIIFSRGDYLSSLAVDVNGTPRTPSLIKDIASPFPVKIYEITTVANDLVHITGVVAPSSLGARAIQGFLAQNAAAPVYDTASLQVIYDAEQANDMYLTPGQYNYVFFDKYTYNNDSTDDSRNLNVYVDGGPAGSLVNQSHTKPAPAPTEGAVVGSYSVPADKAGTYTLHINTEDSVYWLYSSCMGPVCGDGIKNGTEECDGTDGVGLHQSCSQTCTIIDLPYCGNGEVDSGETCDDGNTTSGDGCSATCQTEGGGEQNGSLKICKYKDTDGLASTTNDRVIVSDWSFSVGDSVATSSQATLTDGCTIFSALTPNEYLISEELKAGWRYFEPANGQATSTIVANVQNELNFYNYRNTYCGDGIKQSPNEMLLGGPANDGNEACDGTDGVGANQSCTATCTLTNLPYCGDNVCSNNESCSSCSTDCGSCGGGGGGGGGGGIILTGLTFNNLGSVSNLCSTVLVNWSTSEFATSRVLYDTVSHPDISAQTSPNYGYASSTLLDATPVTGHNVAIIGLTPGATYYLRPVSTTASGEKLSNELTVVVNSNCGQVLGVKITAPAPPAGQVLGVKILKATGFSSNELSWLIAIILLLYGSSGILRKYAGVYA